MSNHSQNNSMAVNVGKTGIVRYRSGGPVTQSEVFYQVSLSNIPEFRYLGNTLCTKLSSGGQFAIKTIHSLMMNVNFDRICLSSTNRLLTDLNMPFENELWSRVI